MRANPGFQLDGQCTSRTPTQDECVAGAGIFSRTHVFHLALGTLKPIMFFDVPAVSAASLVRLAERAGSLFLLDPLPHDRAPSF